MQKIISIGFKGEQYSRSVVIELRDRARWPNAFVSLAVIRPGEDTPYFAAGVDVHGSALEWTPNGYDTQKCGTGKAVIIYSEDRDAKTIIGKSPVFQVEVCGTLPKTDQAEVPDPYEAWVATLLQMPAEAYRHMLDAQTAQGKAEDAQAAAETAQGKAEDAQEAAETAQGKAEDAQEAAETAQSAAAGSATAAAASEDDAEAWANGTRDGTDVPSTDPAYRNNAKYWRNSAETHGLSAYTYAQTAEAYGAGTKVGHALPATDPAYHNNAKYYSDQAAGSAAAAAGSEDDAEAWAKGTKNGTAVPSTDPAYHDNAKYYSDQAHGDATAAAGSAAAAAVSEDDAEAWTKGTRNGTAVPSTDPAYHNNAKYYADEMAATVEYITRQAVVEAAGNAEAWAVGQRGGEDVESTDPAYHNNAKYWRGLSQTDASIANNRAQIAEAYGAGTKGGNAVPTTDPAYHNNAKYYSELAQQDANTAAGSATAAAGSATTAAGHVTAAEAAQAAAEAAAQEAIDTVVAAQGPGIVYMDENGFFILEEDE